MFQTDQEKCWELGGEILDRGLDHGSLATVKSEWDALLAALADAQQQSRNLKRVGVGRTEDPTLIIARIVPALRELARTSNLVADQMVERLSKG